MIWSARTRDGAPVLLLLEFQRTSDPLMALRTTSYATLKLERIAAADRCGTGDRLPAQGDVSGKVHGGADEFLDRVRMAGAS